MDVAKILVKIRMLAGRTPNAYLWLIELLVNVPRRPEAIPRENASSLNVQTATIARLIKLASIPNASTLALYPTFAVNELTV